ncbi:hypothetical protein GE061_008747 [Apolygus lucorum]|uniref:Uncharacterized protein n=1 Tax=Apolygus lucorum TaxID=248454 RepID=A0A8S9WNM5_APOLU|nr:hypothetical protein GE061_008747 [Apolygus lucorum]
MADKARQTEQRKKGVTSRIEELTVLDDFPEYEVTSPRRIEVGEEKTSGQSLKMTGYTVQLSFLCLAVSS